LLLGRGTQCIWWISKDKQTGKSKRSARCKQIHHKQFRSPNAKGDKGEEAQEVGDNLVRVQGLEDDTFTHIRSTQQQLLLEALAIEEVV
jgi:hypothetical protein